MRYYFAGAYARRAQPASLAADLVLETGAKAKVVSRWLRDPQEGLDAGFSADGLKTTEAIKKAWQYGQRDLEDLAGADAIVSFTGEGVRGGRHIEHGYAIGLHDAWPNSALPPIRLVVVGPREHVFHCHPATEQYDSFDAFMTHEIQQYREENDA